MTWCERIGRILETVREDIDVVLAKDPSMRSRYEAALHPTLPAIWLHRVSHWMYGRRRRVPALLVSTLARRLTGVEIHPGAQLGRRLFIDHGHGVVIGEDVVVGDDVMLYHQVTLGALGWWRDNLRPSGTRRHPALGDRIVVGAGALVLGPVVIGNNAVIGAQALVLDDVAPGQRVHAATTHAASGITR